MNNTTKVATATAGIIAIAWLFAKRVSKNSVDKETTHFVVQLSPSMRIPKNMDSYTRKVHDLILGDFIKAAELDVAAKAKAQGMRFEIMKEKDALEAQAKAKAQGKPFKLIVVPLIGL